MKWHYRCPECDAWRLCDWKKRSTRKKCSECQKGYDVPTPRSQHDAYVDTHDWPVDMDREVERVKGKKCTVPKCPKDSQTLDHRVPWSDEGKTSVENLFPMCTDHNESKSTKEYSRWLRELQQQA